MNEIFLLFLSLSVSGSIIAGLMLLLKPAFKNKLSKTWQYYIYLIVILRLLVPFGPETSIVGSMFAQIENQLTKQNIELAPQNTAMASSNVLEETPGITQAEANYPDVSGNALNTDFGNALNLSLRIIINNLWIVWIAIALILFIRQTVIYHRFNRFIRAGRLDIDNYCLLLEYQKLCARLSIKHPPAVYKNNMVSTPMLIGIIKPFIVLPDIDPEAKDLKYILQHELTHYRRLDILYKWLLQLTVCLHWFNPLVFLINKEINRNCELSCDETIIKRLDKKEKYFYGDTLLAAIKSNPKYNNCTISLSLNEDTKLIKERLEAIMKHETGSKKLFILSSALTAILLCGAIFAGCYAIPSAKVIDEMETFTIDSVTYYLVDNEQQFMSIGTGKYTFDQAYMLKRNISLTGKWTAIGNEDDPFTGIFDGNNFEISMPDDPEIKLTGLFGYTKNAKISNLTLVIPEDAVYEDAEYVGAIANYSLGDTQIENIIIVSGENFTSVGKATDSAILDDESHVGVSDESVVSAGPFESIILYYEMYSTNDGETTYGYYYHDKNDNLIDSLSDDAVIKETGYATFSYTVLDITIVGNKNITLHPTVLDGNQVYIIPSELV